MKASNLSRFVTAFVLVSSTNVFAEAVAGNLSEGSHAATISDSQDYDVEVVILDKPDADRYKDVYGITEERSDKDFAETFGEDYEQVASNGKISVRRGHYKGHVGHHHGAHRTCVAGATMDGKSSFYGGGGLTASGQRYNQNANTAANKSLTFGTKMKVTYRGKSVVVTINDDGPHIAGRVLDLSTAAARTVGLTGAGVGTVHMEILSCG
jgi:rare lipoprotein A